MATQERQQVQAVAKWVRLSPQKARVVLRHIRGRSVPEARTVLAFTPRAAAREIEKVLRSAVANAEANHGLVGDELVVSEAFADEGPVLKRWKPRARGRIGRIRKPTCHITIRLLELERQPRAARPQPKEPEKTAEEPTAEEKAESRRRRTAKKEEATA
jgi:large subunit ribosomal protein L22